MSIFKKNNKADNVQKPKDGMFWSDGDFYGGSSGNLFGTSENMGTPFGNVESVFPGSGSINGGGQMRQRRETHFAKAFFIASVIASVLFFFIGEVIYKTLITDINSVFFMGVYYAVFGIVLAAALLIAARISEIEFSSKGILVIGGCIIMVFIFGILFEFLYELNLGTVKVATDKYIFAIDNSGSMEQNDPEQKRIAAVEQLLSSRDPEVEFAVYTFSSDIRCIREMNPISQGIGDLTISPEGGTPIVGILSQIMQDMESGIIHYDEGSQVILLTDGYATDNGIFGFRLNKVLKKFNKKKVSISTVGLGQVDEKLLANISGKTGGISVTTDNVDELGTAMASAVRITDSSRNLLSSRARTSYNWLYAIMRIVFTIILGCGFLGMKIAVTDDSVNTKMLLISSIAEIILGALFIEVGLSLILSEFLARLFLVLCFSLMITTIEKNVLLYMGTDIGQLDRIAM